MKNLVEILKNAPQGLELYSKSEGVVAFEGVNDRKEIVKTNKAQFDKDGKKIRPIGSDECDLFPSESLLTWDYLWEKELFKVGDVLFSDKYEEACIFMGNYDMKSRFKRSNGQYFISDIENFRFASYEEIKKYFLNSAQYFKEIDWKEFRKNGALELMKSTMSTLNWVDREDELVNHCIKSIDKLINILKNT